MIDYSNLRGELESYGFYLFLKKENLLNFQSVFKKKDILITINWYMGGYIKNIKIKKKRLEIKYDKPNESFFEELKNYIN